MKCRVTIPGVWLENSQTPTMRFAQYNIAPAYDPYVH